MTNKGGDLWTKLQQLKKQSQYLTEDEILNNFSQLVSAFLYLHGKDILHRDIKSL
jgi:serine/threonine protein kinase